MNSCPSPGQFNQRLQTEMLPTAWCAGCAIGAVLGIFIEAIRETGIADNALIVYSGIGCTGQMPNFLHITNRFINDSLFIRAIEEDRKKNAHQKAVVFLDNADILYSGLKDWMAPTIMPDVLFIHVNNTIFIETKKRRYANTPFLRRVDEFGDLPFNMPALAISRGARYVARWTPYRVGWLKYSIIEGVAKEGFSYIEIVSPCVIFQAHSSTIRSAAERISFYEKNTEFVDHDTCDDLDLRTSGKLAIGTFINM